MRDDVPASPYLRAMRVAREPQTYDPFARCVGHSYVTVKPTLYQTDSWVQTQTTACQSKSGPDIWYNWAGTWSLSP